MPGIGSKAAGRMAVRSCEKIGMRLTVDPEVCCLGRSDARAIGRNAARKEREGAAEIAAMMVDMCGWYSVSQWYGDFHAHFHELPSQPRRDTLSGCFCFGDGLADADASARGKGGTPGKCSSIASVNPCREGVHSLLGLYHLHHIQHHSLTHSRRPHFPSHTLLHSPRYPPPTHRPHSLSRYTADTEAVNAEPNPQIPHCNYIHQSLHHHNVARRSSSAPGCSERLPQEPRRFRQHHHPDREEAPEAWLPVQCYLRW